MENPELPKISGVKTIIADLIKKNKWLLDLYQLYKFNPDSNSIQGMLAGYSKKNKVKFIQIGGNDGQTHDPLYLLIKKYKWKGIILEPQKGVFEDKLKKTYKHKKNIKLINAAIDSVEGERALYKISFSENRWATGLSTFMKSKLEDNIASGYIDECAIKWGDKTPENKKDYITEEQVECISFQSLLTKYEIATLDLLAIDAEGYDFEIIKMFDFDKVKPLFILYEHGILSFDDKINCEKFLSNIGYSIFKEGNDTLAYL